MLASTIILGIGIVMGAYWAYETLNFNGYWSWDPVENAVYIPWLIQVAALHCLLIADKKPTYYAYYQTFAIVSFLLVLYSSTWRLLGVCRIPKKTMVSLM